MVERVLTVSCINVVSDSEGGLGRAGQPQKDTRAAPQVQQDGENVCHGRWLSGT